MFLSIGRWLAAALRFAAIAIVITTFVSPASAVSERSQGATVRVAKAAVTRTGEVYLIRGLANIFSLGMDSMAKKMRDKGLYVRTFNHSGWKGFANKIIKRAKDGDVSYPIVIAGHSLGANSATAMANYLTKKGVKVGLVVAFDPTLKRIVKGDISQVINYYIPNGSKNEVYRGQGFRGKVQNVDVSDMRGVNHMNVEKNKKLQTQFIDRVLSITKDTRRAAR
ncbi:MAG: hypothetical protein NXI27_03860 [Alphaproteobacteria bacterium]|nr:hypothetical protein [Alphaproteobacteria bacterium]